MAMPRTAWVVLGLAVAAGWGRPGAAQFGDRAPAFAAEQIPDPPGQGAPWVAPATRLPRFLVTATGLLLDEGVADPRGGAYRAVEIDGKQARGFVLPERAGVPERYVVAWDGLVYPVTKVGERIDLDAEIRELAAHARTDHAGWGWPSDQGDEQPDRSGVGDRSPLKVCLLLRLGRTDLAEALFAAVTGWDPERRGRDLTDYGISYVSLADDWAVAMYRRLIGAHEAGRDAVALDSARRLARFRDLVSRQADAMGFARLDPYNQRPDGPIPYFGYLDELDALLRDHERRARLGPRGPVPPPVGGDPAARVAALIRDLDLIDERQFSIPGAPHPEDSRRVADLVAEGAAAVGPLLDALEVDDRLTRSVNRNGDGSVGRHVHPVAEVEFAALTRILRDGRLGPQRPENWSTVPPADRPALIEAIRRSWLKGRWQPPAPGQP